MPLTHQPYSNRNFEFWEIHDLLTESYALTGRVNLWSFGRIENWRYRIHAARQRTNARFLSTLARLWRDDTGRLLGIALSEDAMNDIHVIVRQGYKEVEQEIYTWVNTELAKRHPRVETTADVEDEARRELLAGLGYRCQGESEYLRYFDLKAFTPEAAQGAEGGWVVQDVLVDRNLEERARTMGSAFRASFVLDQDYVLKWDAARQAPGYLPSLELAAVLDRQDFGAVCFGWVDPVNRVGEIEPLGTHPHHRRRGLASALVNECFTRMKALGLSQAWIASGAEPNPSNRFYDTLKPVYKQVFEQWVKVYR